MRFPHSTMQAYIGSWLIGEALKDPNFNQAFKAPGRELLMALVMFSRREEALRPHPDGGVTWLSWLSTRLCTAAEASHLTDAKKIELLTAAVEIDSVDTASPHRNALEQLVDQWSETSSWEDAPRDAKLVSVALVGACARRLTPPRDKPESGFYAQLYRICCNDRNYQIRLAAAQEIGTGGTHAFEELREQFRNEISDDPVERAKQIRNRTLTFGDGEDRYRYIAQAWLLPMIVGSGEESNDAKKRLGEWLELVGNGLAVA